MQKNNRNKGMEDAHRIITKELEVGKLQLSIFQFFINDDVESICKTIIKQSNFRDIAVIMKALVAYNPSAVEGWLHVLMMEFKNVVEDVNSFCRHSNIPFSPQFTLGYITGVFESAVFFDQHCFKSDTKKNEPFNEAILDFVDYFLFNNPITFYADILLPSPKFEGRLSNAIKAFIRGNKEAQSGHYGFAVHFVKKVLEERKTKRNEREDKIKSLSKIGRIILDQFNYPLITELSTPIGRAQMVYEHFKKEAEC